MTLNPADRKFLPGGSQAPSQPERPASPFPDLRTVRDQVPWGREAVLDDPLQLTTQFVNPELARQREQAKPRVMAALALHLGGQLQGLGSGFSEAVGPLADRFLDIAQGEPALVRALEEDVNALWALSDEQVADRIARGEPLSGFGDVMDSLSEVYWAVGADALYARTQQEATDAMRGAYDGIDAVAAAGLDDRLTATLGDSYLDEDSGVRSGLVKSLVSRPTVWSSDGDGLAVTVEANSGPVTYALQLRPGQKLVTDVDVIAAVVEAAHAGELRRVSGAEADPGGVGQAAVSEMLDGARAVGKFVDGVPGATTAIDHLWKLMTPWLGPARAQTGGAGPLENAERRIEAETASQVESATKLASVLPFPEELMVAQVASRIVAEGGIGTADALDLAAQAVGDERDNLEEEWRKLTADELISQAEAAGEDRSALGEVLDSNMASALSVMEAWDAVSQRIGVNVVDFVWDAAAGTWETVAGDSAEGARRFREMWEAPVESDVAEYWGLEGGAADLALFGAGMAFDPTTYLFGGSKFGAKLFRNALTNPRYAPVVLRLGPMRQITRNIALDDGSRAVRSVLSLSGITDQGYVDLLDLARRKGSRELRGEVEQVLLRELPSTDGVGFFLGEGPRRAYRRQTAQGVARTLENVSSIPGEHWPELFRMLARLDSSRSMGLGESTFLDDFFDMLVTVRPDDPDFLERWATEAIDAVASLRGAEDARRGVLTLRKQRSRELLDNMAGARSRIVDDPVGIRQNMAEIRNAIDQIDGRLAGVVDEADEAAVVARAGDEDLRAQLEQMHGDMSERLARAEGRHGSLTDKSRRINRELGAATRLEGEMATPESRAALSEVVLRFYDDWAERINAAAGEDLIPVVADATSNPMAPGVPVRDWSAVTGGRKGRPPVEDPTLQFALAGDDVSTAQNLSTIGMFNRSTQVRLPASPYEMVVFEKLSKNKAALAYWQNVRQREKVRTVMSAVKTMYAANLLLNPVTIGRVHLDETLRFLADTGSVSGFVRSNVVAVPGMGRFIRNPYALQHGRAVATVDEIQPWDWVERPRLRHSTNADDFVLGDYRRQVERWVNGTLLNDDIFSQYAHAVRSAKVRFIDDAEFYGGRRPIPTEEWRAWWDEGAGTGRPGKANVRGNSLQMTSEGGSVTATVGVDADETFGLVHNAFEYWLDRLVDPKMRSRVRDALLDAASGRRGRMSITDDARILNAVKRVPGQPAEKVASVGGLFNMFFGQPSARRGGVFFEHYFDEAMRIYRPAFEGKGRLITKETLMERAGMTAEEADWALRQGSDNEIVRRLMAESGAVTERTLEAQAARYAGRRSEDLMYQLTASSIAGKAPEAALAFPYARAATDFLSWWGNHLTRPMQFRLGPRAREALARHPILSKPIEVLESTPLNVRAMARFAHLQATLHNEHESFFDQAIDDLTFLPTRWSREVLLGITPLNPGPLPSWLLDGAVADGRISEETNEWLETIFPSLGFTDSTTELPERIFPIGRTSVRDALAGALRAVAAHFGDTDLATAQGTWARVHNALAADRRPLFTADFQAELFGEWLSENAFTSVPGSDGWLESTSSTAVAAAVEANKADWAVKWRNRIPLANPEVAEYRSLGNYAGLFDDQVFARLVDAGAFDANDLIPDDETGEPRIRAVFERMEAGTATVDEKRWLGDALATVYHTRLDGEIIPGLTLRDWVTIQNPAIAVNLISKWEGSGLPVRTDAHRDFVGRYIDPTTGRLQNVPPGPSGSDIVNEAQRNGWVVARPADGPDGWMRDAHEAALQSADRAVRAVWRAVTGRDWSQDSTTRRDSDTGIREPGVKQSLRDVAFELPGPLAGVLEATGLDVAAGDAFTVQEFRYLLDDHRKKFATRPPIFDSALQNNPMVAGLSRHDDDFGRGLVDAVQEVSRRLSDQELRFEDLPAEVNEAIRGRVRQAITLGYVSERDYSAWWEPIFGQLDYEPPTPPPVADLPFGISVSRADIASGGLEVIDGDTVSVAAEDGPLRVRFIGINAPEVGDDNYVQAVRNLEAVIARADEVVLGIFEPETFGVSQMSGPDDRRMLAWLYVDGVPIYDPSIFGADNPRGAGVGGKVLDLEAILDAGRSAP